MAKTTRTFGDFGFKRDPGRKNQVVGIFDLVGFTRLDSNRDLVQAVGSMETSIRLFLSEEFWWGETSKSSGNELAVNDILVRSTGDGYVLIFSENFPSEDALTCLRDIHTDIARRHEVRLGINRGDNYVLKDLNERMNIIGWGINLAARALSRAEPDQIICTGHFAEPIIENDQAAKS